MATIVANPHFNAEAAATSLRNAMKGLGTDEEAIIKILVAHSNAQRVEIKSKYKTTFGRDLGEDLKSELGGNFEDAVLAMIDPIPIFLAKELMAAMKELGKDLRDELGGNMEDLVIAMIQPVPQFLARQIYYALQGAGTDESTLIEILCPRPNHEIKSIKAHYEDLFKRNLEEDIKGETSGNFENLLVSMCTGNRDESTNVDQGKAETDANALIAAGLKQVGTDESEFNRILCTRSFAQLRATFEKYRAISGVGILDTISNEMSGTLAEGFSAIVGFIWDSAEFFASRINKAIAGAGTDDKSLIRLIVTRCEFDLKNISRSYQKKYGKALGQSIKEDCSGDYCRLLLAILGNN